MQILYKTLQMYFILNILWQAVEHLECAILSTCTSSSFTVSQAPVSQGLSELKQPG